jgi:hypothetical protein
MNDRDDQVKVRQGNSHPDVDMVLFDDLIPFNGNVDHGKILDGHYDGLNEYGRESKFLIVSFSNSA